MTKTYSSALPIAELALRIIIVLNWLSGVVILALLTAMVVATEWTLTALGITPETGIPQMLPGLQAIAALGLVTIPLNHVVLSRLLGFVKSVRTNAFVPENARRLKAIAWSLFGLQIIGLIIAAIGKAIETAETPLDLDAGFSTTGWLAVLLAFVLAGVFAQGTRMQEDLDGTV